MYALRLLGYDDMFDEFCRLLKLFHYPIAGGTKLLGERANVKENPSR